MESFYEEYKNPFQELFNLHTPQNKIIYHYCSVGTFEKIIKNKEFWLTETAIMNDTHEGRWLNRAIDSWYRKTIQSYKVEKWKQTFNKLSNLPDPESYICCFSTEKDILSQWRAYADDGKGVAVGIDLSKMKIRQLLPFFHIDIKCSVGLSPVFYTQSEQECIIQKTLHPHLAEDSSDNFDSLVVLKQFGLVFKNPAFSEEKEYRLICIPAPYVNNTTGKNHYEKYEVEALNISRRDFRVTNNGLSPFFKYSFENNNDLLTEIVLGPKNNSLPEHIQLFLKKHNLSQAVVTRSSATYR